MRRRSSIGTWFSPTTVAVVLCALVLLLGPVVRDLYGSITSTLKMRAEYLPLSRTELIQRIETLEADLSRVEYQSVLYESLADDIRQLETELGLRPVDAYGSARVIANVNASVYGTIIIDAGQTSGVTVNDYVTSEGVYVGRVISVDPHQSLVRLATSAGEVTMVSIADVSLERSMRGVGGAYELDIPQSLDVPRGALIRESSLGLPMARIIEAQIEPTNTVITAMAASLAHNPLRVVSLVHRESL
ncbi:MAG: rod shape-determining protein MreC [Patescibacteria group bacterium]